MAWLCVCPGFAFFACWSVYLLFISFKNEHLTKVLSRKELLCQSISETNVLCAHPLLFQLSHMIPGMSQVIHPHVDADLTFVIDFVGARNDLCYGCGHGRDTEMALWSRRLWEKGGFDQAGTRGRVSWEEELSLVHQTCEPMGSWKPAK